MSLFLRFCNGIYFSFSSLYSRSNSKQLKCRLKISKSFILPGAYNLSRCNTFCTDTTVEDRTSSFKNSVKYETILEGRRREASRSALIQVHSEQSCSELYHYCNSIAPVNAMFHYTLSENNHFVLVEFGEDCIKDVHKKCTHLERGQSGVPVQSPLLWFRARPKGKTKLVEREPPPSLVRTSLPVTASQANVNHWLSQAHSVEDEIRILNEGTRLDEVGSRLRYLTAYQIESCLSGMFPLCKALPFGSSVNGLGRVGCDLDIYLEYDPSQVDPESRLIYQCKGSGGNWGKMQRQMEAIADVISIFLPGCGNVKRILKAKVPIVKFDHEMTAVQCDLSMSNMSGVYMSELVWLWGEIEPRMRPLVTWLKSWAEASGLTHPTKTPGGWITNFSLTLLVVFYLQNIRLLPTLDTLISMARSEDVRYADEINCTFVRDASLVKRCERSTSLGQLLRGFYEFYSGFDFGTSGVSVCTGRTVVKPDHSALYVVNPLERTLNVAKNVTPKEIERLRVELRNAQWTLDSESSSSILYLISGSDEASRLNREELHHQSLKFQRAHRMVAVKDLFSDDSHHHGL